MNSSLLLLQYLCFMNAGIGLTPAFTTQHCAVYDSDSTMRLCNGACNTAVPTSEKIKHIKSFFGKRPFTWIVDANDTQTRQALEKQKLFYMVAFPAMAMTLGSVQEQEYGADITVQTINAHDTDTIPQFIDLKMRAFTTTEPSEFCALMNLCLDHITPGAMTLYVGYYQGQPAAVGMTLQHDKTATLHWIGTLPEYRNKGLGYAIMHKALVTMQDAGCTQALLLATGSGKSLYERMGFIEYATYAMYGNFKLTHN